MPKSHWIISIIISLSIIALTLYSFKGCGIYPEWYLKHIVENSLEEKYGEEFYCYDVWGDGKGVCSPEKNHDIRFEVSFHADGKIVEEGYYAACVAEQIEEDVQKELENVFNDFYLHSYMTFPLYSTNETDIYAENVRNESFDIDEYISLANEKWKDPPCISFVLCINAASAYKLSIEEEYDRLYNIFTHIEELGINTIPYIKFLPENVYLQCIDYFKTRQGKNSTYDDMVREYPIKNLNTTTIFVYFQECELKLTKEEYIKQRKEVN